MNTGYNNYSDAYPKPIAKVENNNTEDNIYSFDIKDIDNFKKHLVIYKIVVVKAWASWCEPCKLAGKRIETLGKQLKDYIDNKYIVFLNDNIGNENSLHKGKLEVVPTFFIYFKGKLVSIYNGLEFNNFQDKIVELLNTTD